MKIKILSLNKAIEDHGESDLVETIIKPRAVAICLFSNDELVSTVYKSQIKVESNAVFIENPEIPEKFHNFYPHLQIEALKEIKKGPINVIKEAQLEVLYLAPHTNADESIKSIKEQIEDEKKKQVEVESNIELSDPSQMSVTSG